MAIDITGRALTDRAPRYLKQLCKHLSEKIDVEYDETSGVVRYKDAVATLTATDRALEYAISGATDLHAYRAMGIVAGHLEKFGARDGLVCSWDDASVEAEYRARRQAMMAQRRAEVEAEEKRAAGE